MNHTANLRIWTESYWMHRTCLISTSPECHHQEETLQAVPLCWGWPWAMSDHFFGDTCYMSKVFWISKTFLKLHHFQVAQNLWLNCSLLLRISACSSVSNTSWIRIFTYVHLLSHLSPGPAGYQEMAFFRGGLTLSRRQQYRRALPTTALYPLIVCHRSLLAFVDSLLTSLQQVFTVIVLAIKGVRLRF